MHVLMETHQAPPGLIDATQTRLELAIEKLVPVLGSDFELEIEAWTHTSFGPWVEHAQNYALVRAQVDVVDGKGEKPQRVRVWAFDERANPEDCDEQKAVEAFWAGKIFI